MSVEKRFYAILKIPKKYYFKQAYYDESHEDGVINVEQGMDVIYFRLLPSCYCKLGVTFSKLRTFKKEKIPSVCCETLIGLVDMSNLRGFDSGKLLT